MRYIWPIICVLCAILLVQTQIAKSSMPTPEELGSEFKRLRTTKGHFEGGEWNEAVDSPNGRKHVVMTQIVENLATCPLEAIDGGLLEAPAVPGLSAHKVIFLLGKPDKVVLDPKDIPMNREISPLLLGHPAAGAKTPDGKPVAQKSPTVLVYYWRGKHDFLYFRVDADQQTVSRVGWWGAGE
eukprot:Rmarinus@m.10725